MGYNDVVNNDIYLGMNKYICVLFIQTDLFISNILFECNVIKAPFYGD